VLSWSVFTRRDRGKSGMTSEYSVYQLIFDPGTSRLRSSNTTIRVASFSLTFLLMVSVDLRRRP
jgi:hypothetical protein